MYDANAALSLKSFALGLLIQPYVSPSPPIHVLVIVPHRERRTQAIVVEARRKKSAAKDIRSRAAKDTNHCIKIFCTGSAKATLIVVEMIW